MSHPTVIGPYTIEREIARGGMGIVYLAKDDRLDRTVAIKSLPSELADSAERLARFEREAKALAALNHTNIAGIHSVEEVDGARYLVLEFVEGITLSERITQGPQPVDETLDICRQIAEGIEAAHEAGVIHRDLKPGNVIVRPDGVVKVVDFGLAKEIESRTSSLDLTNMPTATMPNEPVSVIGQVIGTPSFLSPEQARGKQVDRRTDIWSFGCVLFECLTGERLFGGETTTDSLAAILEREPRWDSLPNNTPPRIRELLRACLEKDPRSRLRDIGDARLEIERALANKEWSSTSIGAYNRNVGKPQRRGAILAMALIAFALGAGVMSFLPSDPVKQGNATDRVRRYSIRIADDPTKFHTLSELTISRDGQKIAYRRYDGAGSDRESTRTVFVRDLSALTPRVIPGAEEAQELFFSPDGRRIGLHTGEAIKAAPVNGGPLTTLYEELNPVTSNIRWLNNDTLIKPGYANKSLEEISLRNRSVRKLCEASPKNGFLGIETFCPLPDGNGYLISGWTGHTVESYSIAHLSPEGEVRVLLADAGGVNIVDGRYLVFMRRSTLFAAPFDVDRVQITSEPVPVLAGVKSYPWGGGGQMALSPYGDLVYQPGDRVTTGRRLVWVDMDGTVEPVFERTDAFMESVSVSGDGQYAMASTLRNKNELWRIDLTTGARDRIWDEGEPSDSVLNHDGSRIAFSTPPTGGAVGSVNRIVIMNVGSSEKPVFYEQEGCLLFPYEWTLDEQTLVISRWNQADQDNDLLLLDLETMETTDLLATDQMEYSAALSPDGKWMAYGSYRTGERNVYLRAFPNGDTDTLITPGGAMGKPYWSADGKSIYYAQFDTMMAVDIETEPALKAGKPIEVFKWPWPDGLSGDDQVTLAPDGRFLMIEPAEWEKTPPEIIVVHNWLAELDERFGKN